MTEGTAISDLPVLAPRSADSNKGNYGRVLVVAGSRGMSGAAVLCASAALRSGAGLVRVAVPAEIQATVAAGNPCYMTTSMPGDEMGRLTLAAEGALLELAEINDVVALGPGLGQSEDLSKLVTALIERVTAPLVLDADGLNAVKWHPSILEKRSGALIVTPHPGEFARLTGSDVKTVQSRRLEMALEFAAEHEVIVVLKGHGTVVTDGTRYYVCTAGNPGMASGGTGDVLTGVIAALLGQGLDPFAAAQLGVVVHARAGDLARDHVGEVSLMASDLLEFLPKVFRSLG